MSLSRSDFQAFAARHAAGVERAEARERARCLAPSARRAAFAALDEQSTRARADDDAFVAELARALAAGELRGAALADLLSTLAAKTAGDGPFLGDDPLDALLEALLGTHGRYDGRPPPGHGLIHYDPSPAALTLALAARGWFSEGAVFVDLGSGTGRVTTLAALLGRARVVAVELDAELAAVSQAAAARLGASVEHRVGDARVLPLEDATDVFFFAPFVGPALDEVLGRLVASTALTRVGSWGPATAPIARHPGLRPDRPEPYGPFDLASFRKGNHAP